MFAFAQFTGLLATILNIGKYFIKDNRVLLVLLMGIYLFLGVTFLLLGAYSGAIICMIIGTLIMVEYLYEQNDEKLPNKVLKWYAIGYLVAGVITIRNFVSIVPFIIAILYTIVILKQDENRRSYRILELLDEILWTIYTISVGGYTIIISTLFLTGLHIKDIYNYDIKKETEPMLEIEVDFAKEAEERENIKKEEIEKSKESLKKGESSGEILLTSHILTGEKRRNISYRIREKRITGKRGYYTGFEYKRRR